MTTKAPQKAHHRPHPAAPLRHHTRTSSGGSSKLGLHLQFTQKDHLPLKHHDQRSKRSSTHHESYPLPHSRSSSASPPPLRAPVAPPSRTHSKDHLSPHKHTTHRTHARNNSGAKSRPDFTLASPPTDESDWVSSESGDRDCAAAAADKQAAVQAAPPANSSKNEAGSQLSEMPVVQLPLHFSNVDASVPVPTRNDSTPIENTQLHPRPQTQTQPKPQPRPRIDTAKRQSRPSSMYSITHRSGSPMLRPHPLIRGLSSNPPCPVTPLAQLTITPDNPAVQLSSSPPPLYTRMSTTTRTGLTASPTVSPYSPPASPIAGRRTSISSARSVATLPVSLIPFSASKEHAYILGPDRHRANSAVSTASSTMTASEAALSSLAHLPTTPRSVTPQFVSHFPPVNPNLETIHPLLPPPYLATHLTVLSHRSPLRESYDRVIRAKLRRMKPC